MTILQTVVRGIQASVTWNNINISQEFSGSLSRLSTGPGWVDLAGGRYATYERIYTSQIWVHAIVNKLSRGIGRLPLKVYSEGDARRERVREGPLPDLLRRPWPGGSPFALKSAIVANLAVFGNSVVVPVRPSLERAPTELWPSSFRYWEIVPGKQERIDWYIFHNGQTTIPFRPEEVVHFKWWGTGQDLIGASPVEALRTTLRLEDAAQRMHLSSYENGGRPTGVYTLEGNPSRETIEMLRAELEKLHGGVDNAFRIAIMGGGAKWSPMSHNLNDAQMIETRRLTREECAAAYDMPPPVIQILDRATFSNITEQHLMLYMDTMGPWLTLIEETLQAQLIDPEPRFRGQFVEFDLNEVLKGDITKRMEAYSKAYHMSLNERRERENLPRKDDPLADAIWMPPGFIPIGEGVETGAFTSGISTRAARANGTAEDVHCPRCGKLLARGFVGRVELYCPRCKMPVPVDNRTEALA